MLVSEMETTGPLRMSEMVTRIEDCLGEVAPLTDLNELLSEIDQAAWASDGSSHTGLMMAVLIGLENGKALGMRMSPALATA